MLFIPQPRVYADMPMWAAKRGGYSFIISEDNGVYAASARIAYTTEPKIIPNRLVDLGRFESMQKAIEACEGWKI